MHSLKSDSLLDSLFDSLLDSLLDSFLFNKNLLILKINI